jgi:hypothetical protein
MPDALRRLFTRPSRCDWHAEHFVATQPLECCQRLLVPRLRSAQQSGERRLVAQRIEPGIAGHCRETEKAAGVDASSPHTVGYGWLAWTPRSATTLGARSGRWPMLCERDALALHHFTQKLYRIRGPVARPLLPHPRPHPPGRPHVRQRRDHPARLRVGVHSLALPPPRGVPGARARGPARRRAGHSRRLRLRDVRQRRTFPSQSMESFTRMSGTCVPDASEHSMLQT